MKVKKHVCSKGVTTFLLLIKIAVEERGRVGGSEQE
jgi:hypothetical protein